MPALEIFEGKVLEASCWILTRSVSSVALRFCARSRSSFVLERVSWRESSCCWRSWWDTLRTAISLLSFLLRARSIFSSESLPCSLGAPFTCLSSDTRSASSSSRVENSIAYACQQRDGYETSHSYLEDLELLLYLAVVSPRVDLCPQSVSI